MQDAKNTIDVNTRGYESKKRCDIESDHILGEIKWGRSMWCSWNTACVNLTK